MKAQINTHLFTQTRFDSGALTPSNFVVHPFANCGRYHADVSRNGALLYSFIIDVSEHHQEKQISVDLAQLDAKLRSKGHNDCACHPDDNIFSLAENGYGLFYASKGSGGYSVKVHPLNTDRCDHAEIFDSTALTKDDLFGITLLRPGDYILRDAKNKIECKIHVTEVKPGKEPYRPPEALHVDAESIKKAGGQLKLLQAQGLVVRCVGFTRIVIEYNSPIEPTNKKTGTKEKQPPKAAVASWKKTGVKR